MIISILDDYLDAIRHLRCFSSLRDHTVQIWNDHTDDVEVLAKRMAETEALVLIRERTAITSALIERLSKLKIISLHGIFPHVDVEACTRNGIIISSNHRPGRVPSYPTAELTWGLLIAGMRKIPQQMASLKAGKWQTALGTQLRGRTLGIFGYGRLGGVVAGYGKAFGMNVVIWGREGSRERALADGYQVASDKMTFFKQCDVISLHMRLVDATQGIVTASDLALMKPTALIVNTSRAGLIEPGALAKALSEGRPGMAAVDVFEQEPLTDKDDPLLNMNNVVCTPHIGYVEEDTYEAQFGEIFENIIAYSRGKPINVGNPAVKPR